MRKTYDKMKTSGSEITRTASDLHLLTISEAASLIQARQISPLDLTQALLRRVEQLDPQINSFITVTADLALQQAREAGKEILAGRYRGPLHGIPFGLKDLINTAGILTTACSKIFKDNYPEHDATVVKKLYHAGAVLLGKLATSELAHGGSTGPSFDLPWPPTCNPWNIEHHTGGSSSGPAAAVAAGFVPAALGTDTGGSIRAPASLCGVVGLKQTYGLVSRAGVITNSFTFDNCGPLTWTVEDCAILLQAIAGYDPQDPSSHDVTIPDYRRALTQDLQGVRVGVLRHFWEEDLPINSELAKAVEEALDVLKRLGAKIEVTRMRPIQQYGDVKIVMSESELFSVHHQDLIERPQDFGEIFIGRVLGASLFQAVDYVQAQRERRKMISEMRPLYEKYDVLVTPGLGPAARLDAHRTLGARQKPNMTTPFNVTGGPALAQCIGFSKEGLPLSMQVASKPFNETAVFKVAHAYEKATGWRSRRPRLEPGAVAKPITVPPISMETKVVDAGTRSFVEQLVARTGVKLPEHLLVQLCEDAPYVMAMARRIHHRRNNADEPANVFRFPGHG